jgi:long-chain acyl-CoA synthetase
VTYLTTSAQHDPHGIAVIAPQGTLTWAEVESRAHQVAHALRAEGLGTGSRWALLSDNRIEWPELFLGNVLSGAQYVPLNWHLTVPEIVYLLNNSSANFLIIDQKNEITGRAAAHEVGIPDSRIIVLGDTYDVWRNAQTDAPIDCATTGSPLLYTGGTTGASKGVVRADNGGSFDAWLTGVTNWGAYVKMPDKGVCYIATPLYHAFGTGVLQACFGRQHTIVLKEKFVVEEFLRDVEQFKVTSAPMVPTLMVRLAKLEDKFFAQHDLSTLVWITHTAAPCPPWAKQRLIDVLGPIVVEFYGSSEGTGPVVCTSQEWMSRPGTVGKPAPILKASVVDDNGDDLPPGEIGTLYFLRVGGPPQYHGDQAKTDASRLPDGRFTVGDLGYMDAEGFIYLVDRRVDLIISGGSNIYPAEIEGVLSQHPAVRDVAVFGIPHAEFGQEVKAAVEIEPGHHVSESELIAWSKERLASFKCPKSVDFHDALPREAHGKLKKRYLRDAYWPAT